jgi:hypothetical protein
MISSSTLHSSSPTGVPQNLGRGAPSRVTSPGWVTEPSQPQATQPASVCPAPAPRNTPAGASAYKLQAPRVTHRCRKDTGYHKLTLTVFEANRAARAVYDHLGYAPETLRYVKIL